MLTNTLKAVVFALVFMSYLLQAQETTTDGYANLKGTVIDTQNYPLPGASILIRTGTKNYGSTTDYDGKFLVKRIPAGNVQLEISYIGYKPLIQEITLQEGETKTLPTILLEERVERLETITVTGQSLGKLKALNVERNADNILNVVSLEQAEKIPDDNIGDVLKRIAGINIEMDQGEATTASARGLGPESTNILIDGERVSSTSYGGSRAVELDLIPANVIQNIEVSKSVSADMDGESNGATVNLVTRTALSQKTQLTTSAYTSATTTDDAPGYTADINVAKRFFSNKLGVSLNASSSRRNFKSDNIEADWNFLPAGDPGTPLDDTRFLREFEIRQYWLTRVRNSLNFSTDYEINDHHTIGFKVSSSFRDDYENRYRTKLASLEYPISYNEDNTYYTQGDLRMETTGGENGGKPNSYRLDRKKTIYSKFYGDHLWRNTEIEWSASFSSSKKDRKRRAIEYEATEGDFDVKIDIRDPSKPRFEIPNLSNLYNASLYKLNTWDQFIDGNRTSLNLNIEHPTRFGYIKVGSRYRAKKRFEENTIFDFLPTTPDLSHFGKVTSIHYTRGKFYPGDYSLFPAVSRTFLGGLDLEGPGFIKDEDIDERFDSSYDAHERVLAGYGLAKIEFNDAFYIRMGLRVEQTSSDYKSLTFNEVTGGARESQNKERYVNVLPSASLKYEINESMVVRAGFSKTLKRPSHDEISPRYKYEGLDASGSNYIQRGNPDLRPSNSDNYDLSFKYYFGQASSISVDGFAKRINNFIADFITTESIGGNQFLNIESPINVGTGQILGIEITTNINMVDVLSELRNFSIYANFTFNDAELKDYPAVNGFRVGEKRRLNNTSDRTYNLSLIYESDRWEMSGSLHGFSPYLRAYRSRAQNDRYYDGQQFVDLSVSFKLKKGLFLFAQGKNLTNQPLRYYSGSEHYIEQEEFYGPNAVLGLRYKL